ncbi:MAG: TIGR00730 family Rossman fold protein [Gammaproteobacteria bacterium]|jgi:hypothetical protein
MDDNNKPQLIRSICVFAGSSSGSTKNQAFTALASNVGNLLGTNKCKLIYGGGATGIMGAFAKSALAVGAHVTGIIPRCLSGRPDILREVSQLVVEETMHNRKQRMYSMADAFLALPGGIGTLDELVEVLTWSDLDIHNKPILLLNHNNYWNPLLELLVHMQSHGFISHRVPELLHVIQDYKQLATYLDPTSNQPSHSKDFKTNTIETSTSPFNTAFDNQEKAAQLGFAWRNLQDAITKTKEELDELIEAVQTEKNAETIIEEYGDLLFAAINIARYLNTDINDTITKANHKFMTRFRKMLDKLPNPIENSNLAEMQKYWNQAKLKG